MHIFSSGKNADAIVETIGECLQVRTNKNKEIIVGGDFNCNFLRKGTRSTAFREAVEDLGLIIESSTTEPTYVCHND